MRIGFYAALAGLALLLCAPATAKPAHPAHHSKANHAKAQHAKPSRAHADRHYAQSYYHYRSASLVREEFREAPRGHWMRPEHRSGGYGNRERVENLRGDFTGGVGYGANGFVDGYGQTHYFVGSFRGMNSLPHGPYLPNRPGARAF